MRYHVVTALRFRERYVKGRRYVPTIDNPIINFRRYARIAGIRRLGEAVASRVQRNYYQARRSLIMTGPSFPLLLSRLQQAT